MCGSNRSHTLSRLGLLCGLFSLGTLLAAFLTNAWLYTKEPVRLPNSDIATTVTFRIGLWRVCPYIKRSNSSQCAPMNVYKIKFIDDGVPGVFKSRKFHSVGEIVMAPFKHFGKFRAEIIGEGNEPATSGTVNQVSSESETTEVATTTKELHDPAYSETVPSLATTSVEQVFEVRKLGEGNEPATSGIVNQVSSETETTEVAIATNEYHDPAYSAVAPTDGTFEEYHEFEEVDMFQDAYIQLIGSDQPCPPSNAETISYQSAETIPQHSSIASTLVPCSSKRLIHTCIFCQERKSRIVQHYRKAHKNEPRVRKVVQIDCRIVRNREWAKLTGEGDFYSNEDSLKKLTSKSQKTCSHCLRTFKNANIKKHLLICGGNTSDSSSGVLPPITSEDWDKTGYTTEILGPIRSPFVQKMIEKDLLIKSFGLHMWESKCYEKNEMVRRRLTDLCWVKMKLKIGDNGLHTLINNDSVDQLIIAIKEICGYEKEAGQPVRLEKPSTVLRLIVGLKQFAEYLKYRYDKAKNVSSSESVSTFMNIFATDCIPLETNSRIFLKRQHRKNKLPILLTSDLITIKHYCFKVIKDTKNEKPSMETYKKLREAILVRLILYNKRRGNEISLMQISHYKKPVDWLSCASEEAVAQMDPQQLANAKKKKLINLEGKCRNTVQIQLPQDIQKPMERLLKMRELVGVNPKNLYVFGGEGGEKSRLRGTDALRNIKKHLVLERPNSITSTNLRKHAASAQLSVNMTENEQDIFAFHLGHDLRTHRKYYRTPENISEMTTVGAVLDVMDEGKLHEWRRTEGAASCSKQSEPFQTPRKKAGLAETDIKRRLQTPNIPSPPCTLVKYSTWEDITYSDLGIPSTLEFTPEFLSRMRFSTPFEALAVFFLAIATIFAAAGHCHNDHKTLVACGLYIIGGLTLGGGLVIFASVLSDAYFERPRRQHVLNEALEKMTTHSSFDYKYGWSYFAAAAAFVMSEVAAVLNISAYLRRFPTVEDMVRAMVPGAERRLREHQGISGEYLVQHQHKYQRHKNDGSSSLSSGLNTRCYSKSDVLIASDLEGVDGPLLLSKTAPDICTSNPAMVNDDAIDFTGSGSGAATADTPSFKAEPSFILDEPPEGLKSKSANLAGQTVPIVLMHHRPGLPVPPPVILLPEKSLDKRPYCTATLPTKERQHLRYNSGTLPPKHYRGVSHSGVSTLDNNLFKEQLHKKFNDLHEFEGHMTLNQRFGSALSQLSSGLDSGTGTLVGTFQNDGSLIHAGVLGVSSEAPASTTSSSSDGTGSHTGTTTGSCHSSVSSSKPFQPPKKKTVTIGSVFCTMDTFEASKVEDDLFGGASAV